MKQQLSEMTYARDYYYYQFAEKENQLQQINQQGGVVPVRIFLKEWSIIIIEVSLFFRQSSEANANNPEVEILRKQLEDLQLVLYKKDEELLSSKSNVESSNGQPDGILVSISLFFFARLSIPFSRFLGEIFFYKTF